MRTTRKFPMSKSGTENKCRICILKLVVNVNLKVVWRSERGVMSLHGSWTEVETIRVIAGGVWVKRRGGGKKGVIC